MINTHLNRHFLVLCFFIFIFLTSCSLTRPKDSKIVSEHSNLPSSAQQTDYSNKELQAINTIVEDQSQETVTPTEEQERLSVDELQAIEASFQNKFEDEFEGKKEIEKVYAQSAFLADRNRHNVDKWIDLFTGKEKARFQRFLNNAYKYEDEVKAVFRKHQLPEDIFYLGIIESGYYLHARSRANCVGPWQFAAGVGREFGLKVNRYQDERRDILKSTNAAAHYLKYLYNIFGSWELALSAYNAGPYRIIGLIKREKTRDYYELRKSKRFPRETAHYVPKTKAAMAIAKNPAHYGFTVKSTRSPLENTKLIPLRFSHKLSTISRKLSLPVKKIKELNPELRREVTPIYRRGPYYLRIPSNTYNRKLAAVKSLKDLKGTKIYVSSSKKTRGLTTKRSQYAYHRVKRGENLSLIAKKYRTSVSKLKRMNKIKRGKIFPGQKIKLPRKIEKMYIVRRGDNLYKIAKRFGKTPKQLIGLNSLRSHRIYPGQKLVVALR